MTPPERWSVEAWGGVAFAFILGSAVLGSQCAACSPSHPKLTAKDTAEIADTAATILKCEQRGREANSFRVYDACLQDAGLE